MKRWLRQNWFWLHFATAPICWPLAFIFFDSRISPFLLLFPLLPFILAFIEGFGKALIGIVLLLLWPFYALLRRALPSIEFPEFPDYLVDDLAGVDPDMGGE